MDTPRMGRLRDDGVTDRLLEATWTVLDDAGYTCLNIDVVCRVAKAGKAGALRRWNSVDGMVAAAIHRHPPIPRPPNTESLRGDLLEVMHPRVRTVTRDERVCAQLLGAAHHSEQIKAALQDVVRAPLHVAIATVVEHHVARGHPVANSQLQLLTMVVVAMWWDRSLTCTPPCSDNDIAELVDLVLLPILDA